LIQHARLEQAPRAFAGAARPAAAGVARAPASSDAVAEAGNAAYWLGYHHYRRGAYRQAEMYWRTYLDRTGTLLRLAPGKPAWLVERSYALNNLGTLANAQGRGDEAIARFRESAVLKAQAAKMRPDDLDLRYDLIDTLSWISSAEQAQGQLDHAAAGYAAQLDMLRDLIRQRPTALAWERRLATSLRRSAELALMRGRTDDARTMLDESAARLAALLPKAPENRVWRRDLAHALLDRAELARIAGDAAGAIADLRRAAELSSELQAAGGGDQAEWRRLDALIRVRLAALRGQPGREAEAMADLDRLVREVPDEVFGRGALAKELIARGQRRAAAGRPVDAAADYARARVLLARIAPDSRDPTLLARWVQAHLLAGLPADAALARLQASGYRHPDVALFPSPRPANGTPP
ncbi:MAG: winged helix-turn-helix domain-containing protein, partial [Lysobacteraceae bacterium]